MNIEIVILQIVVISCLAILFRSRKNPGWSLVAVSILAIVAIGWVMQARWTPWLALCLWSVGIGFPILCMNRIMKLVDQEKFYQAHRIAKLVRIFHPGDGWWSYASILKAQGFAKSGDLKSALSILEPMQNVQSYEGRLAIAVIHGLQSKWSEYLNFAETQLTPAQRSQENSSAGLYLCALGETRQINELLRAVQNCHVDPRLSSNAALVNLSKLYAFAFTGQVENVKLLFKTSFTNYSPVKQQFWIATSQWCAGHSKEAISTFQELRQYPSYSLQSGLNWRSKQAPLRCYETLNFESKAILQRLQNIQQEDLKYNPRNPVSIKQVPLTYAIVILNCIIFALPFIILFSLFGRISDEFILDDPNAWLALSIVRIYDWAALVPDQFFNGSWWQPLTAIFLHDPSSILHLLFNMLGLMVVGAFVESKLGTLKFAIAYFISGIGSMGILAILAKFSGSGTMSAIGASGAIMGMVGVMAAIYWQGWKQGDRVAKQWLRTVVTIVALQTLFDSLNPNVSMTGHLVGFAIGGLVGMAMGKWQWEK